MKDTFFLSRRDISDDNHASFCLFETGPNRDYYIAWAQFLIRKVDTWIYVEKMPDKSFINNFSILKGSYMVIVV